MEDWLAGHKDPKSTRITGLRIKKWSLPLRWTTQERDDLLRVCHRGCGHSSLDGREVEVPGSQKSTVWDAKEAMKR